MKTYLFIVFFSFPICSFSQGYTHDLISDDKYEELINIALDSLLRQYRDSDNCLSINYEMFNMAHFEKYDSDINCPYHRVSRKPLKNILHINKSRKHLISKYGCDNGSPYRIRIYRPLESFCSSRVTLLFDVAKSVHDHVEYVFDYDLEEKGKWVLKNLKTRILHYDFLPQRVDSTIQVYDTLTYRRLMMKFKNKTTKQSQFNM